MTATLSTDLLRWLPFGVPPGDVTLFCLPHAGGAASAFRAWLGRIPRVSVCAVQPPGREMRLRETPHERMESLVDELADVVLETSGGLYAVYGHSLGALVGFELLREIRRRGGPSPVHLFVSGSAAPHYAYDDGPRVGGMSDPEVVAMLRRLGGTPEWLLSDPAVLSMIIPPFRSDFSIKENYRYQPEAPLDVPVTVLASTDDPRANDASMTAWRDQTCRRFTSHTLVGGHFAVLEQARLSQAYIAEALRPWT